MKATVATSQHRAHLLGAIRRRAAAAQAGQRAAIGFTLAAAFLTVALLQAGIAFDRLSSALLWATVFGLAHGVAWPVVATLAIHGHPSLLPLLAFALSVAGLVTIDFWGAEGGPGGILTAALLLTIVYTGVAGVIALTDEAAYDRFVIRPLVEGAEPEAPGPGHPEAKGLLFVEINGLSEPMLREGIVAGYAPTMFRWLASGRYRLNGWECDFAAQPGAGQAGILHGDNFNIPAFRWYDKATRTIVVSNHLRHGAATIERQISNGHGLLAGEGAARGTLLSGDAVDTLLTCSTAHPRGDGQPAPPDTGLGRFGEARLAVLGVWEGAGETLRLYRQGLWSMPEIVSRAAALIFTTVEVRELSLHRVASDMIRGTPIVYLSYAGYDAAAHHHGIHSRGARRALRRIDQQVALLERAHRYAARPYELVVLSGHGQSQGRTLRRSHGRMLGEVVNDLAPDARVLVERHVPDEHVDTARTLLGDQAANATRFGRWAARLADRDAEVEIAESSRRGRQRLPGPTAPTGGRDILVLLSGNLGLISFPAWSHRLTEEEIAVAFPRLIPGLAHHDAVGFILVTSARDGAKVIGASGTNYLDEECIDGKDPLADHGPHAARHLRRHSLFTNCPDILVHGRYDPVSGEVVSFEETKGLHGGLGGPQAQPFLLYPHSLRAGGPLIGARALYDVFTRWRQELAEPDRPAAPVKERAVTATPGRPPTASRFGRSASR